MNTRIIKIIMVLAAMVAVGGCSSISTQQTAGTNYEPILSAAEASSMIRVTVRKLEPLDADGNVVASAN